MRKRPTSAPDPSRPGPHDAGRTGSQAPLGAGTRPVASVLFPHSKARVEVSDKYDPERFAAYIKSMLQDRAQMEEFRRDPAAALEGLGVHVSNAAISKLTVPDILMAIEHRLPAANAGAAAPAAAAAAGAAPKVIVTIVLVLVMVPVEEEYEQWRARQNKKTDY